MFIIKFQYIGLRWDYHGMQCLNTNKGNFLTDKKSFSKACIRFVFLTMVHVSAVDFQLLYRGYKLNIEILICYACQDLHSYRTTFFKCNSSCAWMNKEFVINIIMVFSHVYSHFVPVFWLKVAVITMVALNMHAVFFNDWQSLLENNIIFVDNLSFFLLIFFVSFSLFYFSTFSTLSLIISDISVPTCFIMLFNSIILWVFFPSWLYLQCSANL